MFHLFLIKHKEISFKSVYIGKVSGLKQIICQLNRGQGRDRRAVCDLMLDKVDRFVIVIVASLVILLVKVFNKKRIRFEFNSWFLCVIYYKLSPENYCSQ